MRFTDKVALITGSSRGIGRAIALRLASEGARIVVNYRRNRAEAEAVADEIKKRGSEALPVQADLSDGEAVRAMFRQVKETFGCLDILSPMLRPPPFGRCCVKANTM